MSPSIPPEDVVGIHEGRFDIDLREFGLSVGPQILVPETPRNLKIAIEARRHAELLIDLRTLRKRVKLSVVQTARHQIVACALGSRFGQNGSLDLDKPQPVQVISARENQPVPELEVFLKLRAAEIQNTMLQPEFLGRKFVLGPAVYRDGRRVGIGQATQIRRADVDLSRRDLWIPVLSRPNRDGPDKGHHVLGPKLMREFKRGRVGPIRPKGHLDQPASVAEVEEDQPAQISAAVNPAHQLDLGPLVTRANASQHSRAEVRCVRFRSGSWSEGC